MNCQIRTSAYKYLTIITLKDESTSFLQIIVDTPIRRAFRVHLLAINYIYACPAHVYILSK